MGQPERILLIDDFDPFSRVIRHILTRRGFSVSCATNPEESLALLEAHPSPIDLVVIDMVSPEAGNLDLSAILECRRPSLPVLYLFGARNTIVGSSIRAQAPDASLVVPFTQGQLLERVNHLLGKEVSPDEGQKRLRRRRYSVREGGQIDIRE